MDLIYRFLIYLDFAFNLLALKICNKNNDRVDNLQVVRYFFSILVKHILTFIAQMHKNKQSHHNKAI